MSPWVKRNPKPDVRNTGTRGNNTVLKLLLNREQAEEDEEQDEEDEIYGGGVENGNLNDENFILIDKDTEFILKKLFEHKIINKLYQEKFNKNDLQDITNQINIYFNKNKLIEVNNVILKKFLEKIDKIFTLRDAGLPISFKEDINTYLNLDILSTRVIKMINKQPIPNIY